MRPLVIGIAGGTGSGKTTVAAEDRRVAPARPGRRHPARLVLPRSQSPRRRRRARSSTSTSPTRSTTPGCSRTCWPSRTGRAAVCPQYDFASHTRLRRGPDGRAASHRHRRGHPALRDPVAPRRVRSAALRRHRRRHPTLAPHSPGHRGPRSRHRRRSRQQYRETVRPMHQLHVAPSRRHAHLIIPEGGENAPALDVIVGRLLHLLGV